MIEGVPRLTPDAEDSEPRPESYNFKEIQDIEAATVSVVEQMKKKIETGEYDTLVSDEVGGRIPTLVMRKIMKRVNPDHEIKTHFIASGKTYFPSPSGTDYPKTVSHMKKVMKGADKTLLVTQYAFRGDTLSKMSKAMDDAGIKNIDIAAINVPFEQDVRGELSGNSNVNNVFVGGSAYNVDSQHEELSGVKKSKKHSPVPMTKIKEIEQDGRYLSQEEWAEIFNIKRGDLLSELQRKTNDPHRIAEFERRQYAPLTEEEITAIKRNTKLARQDIELLANRVVEQVWGNTSSTN